MSLTAENAPQWVRNGSSWALPGLAWLVWRGRRGGETGGDRTQDLRSCMRVGRKGPPAPTTTGAARAAPKGKPRTAGSYWSDDARSPLSPNTIANRQWTVHFQDSIEQREQKQTKRPGDTVVRMRVRRGPKLPDLIDKAKPSSFIGLALSPADASRLAASSATGVKTKLYLLGRASEVFTC